MKFHPPYVSGQMPLLKEEVPSMTPTMENAVAEQTDHQQQHIEASVTAAVIPNGPSLTPSPSSSPLRPTPPLLQTPRPPERAGTQVLPAGAKNVDISYFDSMPPGYRFSPLDDELVVHYLQNKVLGRPLPRNRIIEVNLYAHNPEKLAEEYRQFGEKEWYFFTPRDKKYRNGCRPNRAAGDGYWKATGADRPVYHRGNVVGSRKALVFYSGKAPKGDKTNWIMHEFRLTNSMAWNPNQKASMRLDDWVLCRVRQRTNIYRSSWEGRNGCGYNDPSGFFPKVNEPSQTKTNSSFEMIKSYLLNDCPMLPYIFASQNASALPTASTISFQDSDRSCVSVSGDKSDVKNLQFTDTSLNNLFNPLKRKLAERNQEEISCVTTSQNFTKEHIETEDAIISSKINDANANLCGREPSVDSNFSSIEWNSLMQSPEPHNLDFVGND